MADRLPLLIFPDHKLVDISKQPGFGTEFTCPPHNRQIERLRPQIEKVKSDFQKFKGLMSRTIAGGEPELVLVLKLANEIEDLVQAIAAAGLEWLGEWDVDMEADEDFPAQDNKLEREGCLFVSMVNQQSMNEILSLWKLWEKEEKLPRGKTTWGKIFDCLKSIRRWGMEETLIETGMEDHFKSLDDEETAHFQIECFYRKDEKDRKKVEDSVRQLVEQYNQEGDSRGGLDSPFIHIGDIAFHAVKAHMRVSNIKALLNSDEDDKQNLHIFISPHVMYFRQTGQSIATTVEGDGKTMRYPEGMAKHPPIAAILDGVPQVKHKALDKRIDFDDPFDLAGQYQQGERQHGTQMSSLIIHGDQSNKSTKPIRSKVHHVAIMQPDIEARTFGEKEEGFPVDCVREDLIERAVRRIMEGDDEVEAQAPTVKIINLSLGDKERPFIHVPSPWARLLDWLSWKYRVLFCVSAGNYKGSYVFGMPYGQYKNKSDKEKIQLLLKTMHESLSDRRLIAPAESINALTVGALHQDESGSNYPVARRVDLLPGNNLPSPVSRLGYGFRRAVKPEIYFPGGRQLYKEPVPNSNKIFKIHDGTLAPGQKVAWDSDQAGDLNKSAHTRGTSNATALATRAGVQIHEMLGQLNGIDNNPIHIPDSMIAVLIKALLVHGGMHNKGAQQTIEETIEKHLPTQYKTIKKQLKKILARYLGYGAVDVERVLGCTEQRGTVVGFEEIKADETHEYRFPIPREFGGHKTFRRMVVTLAWLSPINPRHRYLREAKLEIGPVGGWGKVPLNIRRMDSDTHQVKRGTIQHEVLEGKSKLQSFQQDTDIVLQISCKKDATEKLEDAIPYGVAVTLEAAEDTQIPVYEKIKDRLSAQIRMRQK